MNYWGWIFLMVGLAIAVPGYFWYNNPNYKRSPFMSFDLSYDVPHQSLIFSRDSFENSLRAYLLCDNDLIQGPDGKLDRISCVASREDNWRLQERACRLKLDWYVAPDNTEVRLFGNDHLILSSKGRSDTWFLAVLNFKDCTLRQVDTTKFQHYQPASIVTYRDWFFVIISSDRPEDGKCYQPEGSSNVPRCWIIVYRDRLAVDGPIFWFKQIDRDDRMILASLEPADIKSGFLLISTYQHNNRTVARASTVHGDGSYFGLRKFTIMDEELTSAGADPYERIAYSIENELIGICVKSRHSDKPNELICAQWDRQRQLRYKTKFQGPLAYIKDFAVINRPWPNGGMLVFSTQCEQAPCRGDGVGHDLLTHIHIDGRIETTYLRSSECDSTTYRADPKLFQHGPPGRFCVSWACYPKNLMEKPSRNETRHFMYSVTCFDDELPHVTKSMFDSYYDRYIGQWFV